jgi:hypothetical protein
VDRVTFDVEQIVTVNLGWEDRLDQPVEIEAGSMVIDSVDTVEGAVVVKLDDDNIDITPGSVPEIVTVKGHGDGDLGAGIVEVPFQFEVEFTPAMAAKVKITATARDKVVSVP